MSATEVALAIAALAVLLLAAAVVHLRRRPPLPEAPLEAAPAKPAPHESLGGDLALAAEHLHSIRLLLEIARQHQQPIPTAALTNLDLVSKHLCEMQRRVAEPLSPGLRAPLRPPPASSGCRASPSGISTPCG